MEKRLLYYIYMYVILFADLYSDMKDISLLLPLPIRLPLDLWEYDRVW